MCMQVHSLNDSKLEVDNDWTGLESEGWGCKLGYGDAIR